MNLRKKTILAIAITFFLTMLVSYFYIHTLFLKGYLNLENQEIEANVRIFHYTLDYEIKCLSALTNDWAAWDDSYSFMENYSQEYINSNLVDDTFSELGLNFITYFDNKGNTIFKKAYDLEKDVEIPLENSIFTYIKNLINTSPLTKAGEYHQGIFSDKGSPVIFAARPILTSLDEGPYRGTLIFGKYLSGDLFDHLTSSVDSEVSVIPYSPEKFKDFPQSPINPEIQVDASRPDKVHSYSLVRDSGNVPVFIIEQILPRTIYQQGLESGREFLNALMIGSLVASTIILISLELGFLRRFSKLTREIKDFEAERHSGSNMVLKGQDELSILSVEMHNALTKLADTQHDLTTHLDFEKLLVGISTKFINLSIDKIDDGISRLLQVIGEFSKADRGYVRLVREEDPDIMNITHEWCAVGIPSVKESRQNININLSSWWIKTLQKGRPIIINDVSLMPDEAKTERVLFIKQSILSLAAIPLIIGGEFIGLLGYNSIRKKKDWSEQTILLLEVIGAVIANAIDRNRHEKRILLNQLNSSNLNEITKNSIGKSTMEDACRAISSRLSILIRCDDSFLVITGDNKKIHVYNTGCRLNLDARKQLVLQELF
ncbi:MAG: CHASE4 domain-containing protein [Pelolinea sp.]|nr:CHASE4 domain-containing protein [Pelolinea sp.]